MKFRDYINEATITMPSDIALVALAGAVENKRKVPSKVAKELIKMGLLDKKGKPTSIAKTFLNEPKVEDKLKKLRR
jgi:hypothetical protein